MTFCATSSASAFRTFDTHRAVTAGSYFASSRAISPFSSSSWSSRSLASSISADLAIRGVELTPSPLGDRAHEGNDQRDEEHHCACGDDERDDGEVERSDDQQAERPDADAGVL